MNDKTLEIAVNGKEISPVQLLRKNRKKLFRYKIKPRKSLS